MFPENTRELLEKALPVKSYKSGGQERKYVDNNDVKKRLNEAFGHAWSDTVVKTESTDSGVLVQVTLSAYLCTQDKNGSLTQTITHSGFGFSARRNNIDDGDLYKSAHTGAIKSAAKNFGIGLFLEEEESSYNGGTASYSGGTETARFDSSKPSRTNTPKSTSVSTGGGTDEFDPFAEAGDDIVSAVTESGAQTGNSSTPSQSQMNAIHNMAKTLGVNNDEGQQGLIQQAFKAKGRNDVAPATFSELNRKQASDVVGFCIDSMSNR